MPINMQNVYKGVGTLTLTLSEMGELPLGPAYACLMTVGVSMDEFKMIVGTMQKVGIAKLTTEMMTFVPPVPGSKAETLLKECQRIQTKAKDDRTAKAEMN